MRKLFYFLMGSVLLLEACTIEDNVNSGPSPNPNTLPEAFKELYNIFEGGGIGAAANLTDDIILFVSADGAQFAWFEDNMIKRSGLVESDPLFEGLAFKSIGAMSSYAEDRIAVFNYDGAFYQWIRYEEETIKGKYTDNNVFSLEESYALWEWGIDNSCPFPNISASLSFSKEASGCLMLEDDDLFLWMVSADGTAVSRYTKEASGVFDEAIDLETWRSLNVCGGLPAIYPLGTIGAGCYYEDESGIYQELFFNQDGSLMTILTPSSRSFSEPFNLF